MTRRPKLSLEPNQQVRREPPKGFASSAESADHADAPIVEEEVSRSIERSDRSPGTENPLPEKNTDTSPAYHRSPPRFSSQNVNQTSAPPQPAGRVRVSRAALVKILLAAGIAALSILLLKRRFF